MPNRRPTFAIVVPTFNDNPNLPATISSALQQTVAPKEVIVVDDGSTTPGHDVLDSVASMGATVVRRERNEGPAAARNHGASQTTATWLVFLDADSLLSTDALEIFSDVINADSGLVRARFSWLESPSITQSGFLPGTFAVRRAAFDGIGGYDEALRFAENSELALRLTIHLRLHNLVEEVSDQCTVLLRSAGTARNYDADRMRAAIRILDQHAEQLSSEPRERAMYEAIAAVNAMRIEEWSIARRFAWRAARSEPTNPRHLVRAIVSLTGAIGGRRWIR